MRACSEGVIEGKMEGSKARKEWYGIKTNNPWKNFTNMNRTRQLTKLSSRRQFIISFLPKKNLVISFEHQMNSWCIPTLPWLLFSNYVLITFWRNFHLHCRSVFLLSFCNEIQQNQFLRFRRTCSKLSFYVTNVLPLIGTAFRATVLAVLLKFSSASRITDAAALSNVVSKL